jgi:acyl carrier protein
MGRDEIRTRLLAILTSTEYSSLQVDVSGVTDETSLLDDLSLDSLQLLELIVAIECTFGFRANAKKLNIDIFDRFGRVIDFVQANAPASVPAVNAVHAGGGDEPTRT